ncbi:MAG: hypothetical protein AABZ74_13490, partial [Cyanobacteriota bacterium]
DKKIEIENNFANQTKEKFDPSISQYEKIYVLINFIIITIFSVKFLEIFNTLTFENKMLYPFSILFTLACVGLILEKNKSAYKFETVRIILLFALFIN